jgi:FtsP/CotA-like multicopper oxidase with cupredoxin domain
VAPNLFPVSPIDDILLFNFESSHSIRAAADSALIYFAQNGTYLGPISGTNPSPVTSHVGFNENATLPFEPGKTYRLRIVNTSAFAAFYFWIDGHDMRIIEVDGVSPSFPFSSRLFNMEYLVDGRRGVSY